MKRDIQLIEALLEYVEQSDGKRSYVGLEGRRDYTDDQIEYHMGLCFDAGFLRRSKSDSRDAYHTRHTSGLTWEGHNALDKLRSGGDITSIADCTP